MNEQPKRVGVFSFPSNFLSACLSFCLTVPLNIHQFISLTIVCPSVFQFIYSSAYMCFGLSDLFSVCSFVCLSPFQFYCLCLIVSRSLYCQSVSFLSICLLNNRLISVSFSKSVSRGSIVSQSAFFYRSICL